jgi:hypothetical protein
VASTALDTQENDTVTLIIANGVFCAAVLCWTAALPVIAAGRQHQKENRP